MISGQLQNRSFTATGGSLRRVLTARSICSNTAVASLIPTPMLFMGSLPQDVGKLKTLFTLNLCYLAKVGMVALWRGRIGYPMSILRFLRASFPRAGYRAIFR